MKKVGKGLAILSGVAAWEYQSTLKSDKNLSLVSSQRFADAISTTFGPQVAKGIFPNVNLNITQMNMNPQGILNKTSGTGIALLIIDGLARWLAPAEYRKIDGLEEIVSNVGIGLTVGGAVGGFFDAPAFNFGIPYSTNPAAFSATGSQLVPAINR